ncbi:hypothetical protein QZH41_010862 [Actinostola sp. cb2023]|nr:hypothetical protein QZH41_010862 [Actinostola sp. cb2023]
MKKKKKKKKEKKKTKKKKKKRSPTNKTKLERALRKRKAVNDEEFPGVPKKFTRKSIDQAPSTTTKVCFFCEKPEADEGSSLHNVSTFELDTRVRQCAYPNYRTNDF